MNSHYLESALRQLDYYKLLGEQALAQVPDDKLFVCYNEESNSMAMIVQHLAGNMRSRWTDFLTSDGEKEWRNRDAEFEPVLSSRQELMDTWHEGWNVLLRTLHALREEHLSQTVYIRNQGHTVLEAINRQLAHYPYHIGQLVLLGKMHAPKWQSLSIPKGKSESYNRDKFSQPQSQTHFTDDFLNPTDPS